MDEVEISEDGNVHLHHVEGEKKPKSLTKADFRQMRKAQRQTQQPEQQQQPQQTPEQQKKPSPQFKFQQNKDGSVELIGRFKTEEDAQKLVDYGNVTSLDYEFSIARYADGSFGVQGVSLNEEQKQLRTVMRQMQKLQTIFVNAPKQKNGEIDYEALLEQSPEDFADITEIEFGRQEAQNVLQQELQNINEKINSFQESVKSKTGNDYRDALKELKNLKSYQAKLNEVIQRRYGQTQQPPQTTPETEKKPAEQITSEQAAALIQAMEANAVPAPQLELTPENWEAEFGKDGMVQTPVGEVKMGENQLAKMFLNKRTSEFGMVKPTLTNPDVILEVPSEAKEGQQTERESSLIFVKAFNINGKKVYHFESITVSQEGKEVVISNHITTHKGLMKDIQRGKIIYKNEKFASNSSDKSLTENQNGLPNLVSTQETNFSADKSTANNPNTQEKFSVRENPEDGTFSIIDSSTGKPRTDRKYKNKNLAQQHTNEYNLSEQVKQLTVEQLEALPDFSNDKRTARAMEALNAIDFSNPQSVTDGVQKIIDIIANKPVLPKQGQTQKEVLEQALKTKAEIIGNNNYNTPDYLKRYILLSTKDFGKYRTQTTQQTPPTINSEAQAIERKKREAENKKANQQANFHVVTDRWNKAKKVEGAQDEIIIANGEKITGHYALVESGAVTPSHNANSGFGKSIGFPVDEKGNTVNDRDYENDKEAQRQVEARAKQYDSRALQTPVIVSADGVVLSGNDRTMSGMIAAKNNTDAAYLEYLNKYARKFGFTPEQIKEFKHPRVVFVADNKMDYDTKTFAKFNAEEKKTQNKTEQAIKLGKTIDASTLNKIIRGLDGFETMGEFYADEKAVADTVKILVDSGLIGQNEVAKMMDGKVFSAEGRDFLENLIVGSIIDEDAVRKMNEKKFIRAKIVKAARQIVENKTLGDYSLSNYISEAVNLLYDANNYGIKQGESVELFTRQKNLFDSEATDLYNETIKALADILNSKTVNDFKKILSLYNERSKSAASGQTDMFLGRAETKDEILQQVINTQKNGNKEGNNRSKNVSNVNGSQRGSNRAAPNGNTGESKREGSENNRSGTDRKTRFQAVPNRQVSALEQANKRFNDELDNFAEGKQKGELHLGKPLAKLQAAGVQAQEMTITPKVLKDHLNKHGLTTEDLKGLAKAIQDPMIVYEWGSKAKSTVIITDLTVADGRKITVAIKLERNGLKLSVNEVAGVYGKEAQRFVDDMNKAKQGGLKDALRYVEKEKALNWLGLVPPEGTASQANQELNAIAKVIQNFQNPTFPAQGTVKYADQSKSATDNNGNFDNTSNKIRFQFVGEQGAAALDKAEEATTRIDNLKKAREMEAADKDERAIKFATGWERGADGKWRYEISDVEWSDGWYDIVENGGTKRLSDVVENRELFKAYPRLNSVAVILTELNGIRGSYSNGVIMLNRNNVGKKNMVAVISHEIQHAIQDIEGFAKGSNIETEIANIKKQKSELQDKKRSAEKAVRDFKRDNERYAEYAKKNNELANRFMTLSESEYHKQFNNLQSEYADVISERDKLEQNVENISKQIARVEAQEPKLNYKRNAGEAEARNVEHRMNMTPEQRRASLAKETEDVAREDQIFLYNSLSTNESASESRQSGNIVSPIGFFHTTEKALYRIEQEKGTPEQFKAMLLKKGAKQAELDWMGWDDFVGQRIFVTKQQIQEWIDNNRIDVQEVVKDSNNGLVTEDLTEDAQEEIARLRDIERQWEDIENAWAHLGKLTETQEKREQEYIEEFGSIDRVQDAILDIQNDANSYVEDERGETKYSEYTLPGGENYRELLLTLKKVYIDITKVEEDYSKETKKAREEYSMKIDELSEELYVKLDEVIKNAETNEERNRRQNELQKEYRRKMDEALEERGRKIDEASKKRSKNNDYKSGHWDERNILAHVRFNERTDEHGNRVLFIEEIQSDWAQAGKKKGADAVPVMPFRNTDQWVNLALRRMMRYAVENGFDRIAWTTGEMQGDRYNLAKHVDRIVVDAENGKYTVMAIPKGKTELKEMGVATKENLSDYIGKELAEKAIAEDGGDFRGNDLKVGASGMRGFYDKIIPVQASKLGKPFGAKVENIGVSTDTSGKYTTVQSVAVTPEMKKSVGEQGVPLFQNTDKRFTPITEQELEKLADWLMKTKLAERVVTDKVEYQKAWEMVKEEEKLTDKNGQVMGFVRKGVVYINTDHLNANTPIHEFGHRWIDFIKSNNKKLYERGAAIVKRSKYWKEVNDTPFYAGLTYEEKIDEALAMAIGDKGELLHNEKGFGRQLLTWLNQVWNWLQTRLGFENLGHFTDIAVKDLLGGKPLTQNKASGPAQSKTAAQGTVKYADQSKYDFDVEGITEANAQEMQRIKTEAQANGTFMKAPNGKKTNLNERQWLQVRTKAFKKWFGDWEAAWKYDYLLSENWVSELTGTEFQKDETPLTEKVTKFYLEKYNGEVERKGLGVVELGKEGVKDSLAHGIGKVKSAAYAAVPEIIRDGVIIDYQKNWKGRGKDTYVIAAPLKIGNEGYTGIVVVTQSTAKNKFYLHEVILQQNLRIGFKTGTQSRSPIGDFAKIIQNLETAKKNSSKVVDENGEPMVVYHGTRDKSGFTVFDKNKIGSGNDEGFQGRGFYFSGQKRVADQYRGMDGSIYDTFLNIREPYHMSYEESNKLAEANSAEVSQEFTDEIVSEGYDGVFFNANLRDEFVALNPNQIKSAFENNGNFDNTSDDTRFLFVGEQGAAALDKAEEATTRIDNKHVALEMEAADKDERAIKFATGWERGADGKWRYEIPDIVIGHVPRNLTGEISGVRELKYVVALEPEVLKAYPQLANMPVRFDPSLNARGRYDRWEKDITINPMYAPDYKAIGSVLAHEIQHAIQHIEGFARGANSSDDNYKFSAGEAEANNVQRRMGMTPEQRRASLAEETEDVAREDQEFIYEAFENYLEYSKKNSTFVENNSSHGKRAEAGMDNGRAVGSSALRGLVGKQPQGGRIHQTITEASADNGRSSRTTTSQGRTAWSKERFLGQLEVAALSNGTWIDDIKSIAERPVSKGQENEVYMSKDKKHVIKVNNLSLLDENHDFDNFIDRLSSHNELFSNIQYEIIGFAENSMGEVSVVLKQPFINAPHATQQQIDNYLKAQGFRKAKISDGETGWTNGTYELWDAEPRNVLADNNGTLYFIDTVVNHVSAPANTTEMEQATEQFINMERTVDLINNSLDRAVKEKKNLCGEFDIFHIGTVLNAAAEASELTTRFAVYMAYRTSGRDMTEATHAAKEATVNFNRSGNGRVRGMRFMCSFGQQSTAA